MELVHSDPEALDELEMTFEIEMAQYLKVAADMKEDIKNTNQARF